MIVTVQPGSYIICYIALIAFEVFSLIKANLVFVHVYSSGPGPEDC